MLKKFIPLLFLFAGFPAYSSLLTFDSQFPLTNFGSTVTEGDYRFGPAESGFMLWSGTQGGGSVLSYAPTMFFERVDGGQFVFESAGHYASGSSIVTWTGFLSGANLGSDTLPNIIGNDITNPIYSVNLAGVGIDRLELSWTGSGIPYTDNLSLLSAVPVPAAVWLFGTALIGLVGFSKRKKAA